MMPHRKKTRLPSQNYIGHQAYFITICCDLRRPYLADATTARRVIALLHECAASQSFLLHFYCAMPDHVHLLVEGNIPNADVVNLIRTFKLRTAFEFRKRRGIRLWEMSFYDHILRHADAIEDVARYIWWNPVRKALCLSPEDFPYSGSQTTRWMQQPARVCSWTPPWKT
jgi:putative transposase